MQTQAHFEDIGQIIVQEIDLATHSIIIALPGLADTDIFDSLCRKAQDNIRVELLLTNERLSVKNGLDLDELRNSGATVITTGGQNTAQSLNRFCVIDNEIVITGFHNWISPDQPQDGNIFITRDAPDLAAQFITEFRAMVERWERKTDDRIIDRNKLVARLEALRGVIHAEDDDDIAQQLTKLKMLINGKDEISEVREIVALVEDDKLDKAESHIMAFLNTNKQITVYVDPEFTELKLELKSLEIQISALVNEKQEIDRTLHAYQYRHTIELGDLMRQILLLSKEILRKEAELNPEKEAEFDEAQREYEEFEADFKTSSEKEVATLSPEEQQEIKAMFRACTKLCHPDVVADEYKDEAAAAFHKLAEAYEYNDMETVKEVYQNLQKGIFAATSDTLNDVQRMHRSLVSMRSTLSSLTKQIRLTRNSEVYREVAAIADWDDYFATAKQQMQDELERLKGFDDEN